MTLSNFDLILAFTWPSVLMFCIMQRWRGHEHAAWLAGYATLCVFLFADVVNLIVYLHDRNWGQAAVWLLNLGLAIWGLNSGWRNKRRKKATELLGAKSRALRDKLVKKIRDAAPHPAPIPVPA